MRACFLIAAAVACLGACAPVAALNSRDLTAQMETTLAAFRDRHGFPGATAAATFPDGTKTTAVIELAALAIAVAL